MKAKPRGPERWDEAFHDRASDTWWPWMSGPDAAWHIPRALARLARLQRREIERLRRTKMDLLCQVSALLLAQQERDAARIYTSGHTTEEARRG